MIGTVDDRGSSLLDVRVSGKLNGEYTAVTAWIDVHLVLSLELIRELELDSLAQTEAILADGSKITLETFLCYAEWFGEIVPLQVIANDGRFPLLGTGLLHQRILHVDYRMQIVTLD